mmetsp:Transcript_60937/g.180403  ORF Transcript_60937/g.180403 Transcript_60937/m.180403 type:complete len:168 (-) Transcript_60937:171-674(-)|eukprot:CAMPEP_0113530480 /NCGR_PEP_ID=MMETSP0015_2-20120614/2960_1 /TAXON_ID=2838 /ORGANISM="Odontella" /LENGTH=167 /DNA_ID=CAMNT_0000429201 /DNA_START=136 /DNA_END=639 /DNA_ORIENTATION=- /assembly_acc=CAM_ASM_000160
MTVDPELLTGLGAALSIFLTAFGSAIASSHSGIFALRSKEDKMGYVPLMQAGILAVYGIIVGILLTGKLRGEITAKDGYRYLSAGLSVGLGCWASGYGMASFLKQYNEGKATVVDGAEAPSGDQQEPLIPPTGHVVYPPFKKLVFVMISLELIGFYGFVVSLFLLWD